MATFTIEHDKATRLHLATLAKAMSRKFRNSSYQGDYINTVTDKTFGDRVQTGTQRTIGGQRYLFVLNVQVCRNAGGRVAVKVAAFNLNDAGRIAGRWAVARTFMCAGKSKRDGIYLTGNGFERRIDNTVTPTTAQGVAERAYPFLAQAIATIEASLKQNGPSAGVPVKLVHEYGPNDPRYGDTYDTAEEHILPFGGKTGALERLRK